MTRGPPPAPGRAARCGRAGFAAVVDRLRARSQPFGNRPDDPRNGLTHDDLGGGGRVYFVDENGHLFEISC